MAIRLRAAIASTWLLAVAACSESAIGVLAQTPDASAGSSDASSPDAVVSLDAASADASTSDAAEVEDAAATPDEDASVADTSVSQTRPFSVLNLNVLHGFPGGQRIEERTQIVIDAILLLQPDAVTLQETSITSQRPNIAETIAGAVGYEWRWVHAAGVAGVFEEGPAVLSRWPIIESDSVQLEGQMSATGRACIRAKVQLPYGEVLVASTHLTNSDGEAVQTSQASIAYAFISGVRGTLGGFLAGDMNAVPDSLPMRFLRGEAMHEGLMGDLVDAWTRVHPTEPGFTSSADNPSRRIDYILHLPGTQSSATVESCVIMFDQPVNGLLASDHLGLFCRFDL